MTTGTNTGGDGLDVVVEGAVERITGREPLKRLADAFRAKYDDAWDFKSPLLVTCGAAAALTAGPAPQIAQK